MSEEEADRRKLDRLRAIRGRYRGVVTKLCREVGATLEDESSITRPRFLV